MGWLEKWGLKLISTQVVVEVEVGVQLGNTHGKYVPFLLRNISDSYWETLRHRVGQHGPVGSGNVGIVISYQWYWKHFQAGLGDV